MIQGIKLPEEVLRKIYAGNFERIVSPSPKPLNRPLVDEELERLGALYEAMGVAPNLAREVAGRMKEGR